MKCFASGICNIYGDLWTCIVYLYWYFRFFPGSLACEMKLNFLAFSKCEVENLVTNFRNENITESEPKNASMWSEWKPVLRFNRYHAPVVAGRQNARKICSIPKTRDTIGGPRWSEVYSIEIRSRSNTGRNSSQEWCYRLVSKCLHLECSS